MGMVGLRDVLVVAPAASFHHPPLHHEAHLPSAEHPIIPILNADNTRAKPPGGIQLWQAQAQAPQAQQLHYPQPQAQNPNPNTSLPYLKKPMAILDGAAIFSGGGGGGGGGMATCQDCGNQAKKDCTHRRCRTCCKSRGFDCSTHVKSTWVPAARRRDRQHHLSAAAGSSASTSTTKKPRLISSQTTASHTSTSNTTPPRSFDTSSSHQDASLPGHVRAPAVFKCVRVTSMEDGEDEYAYQAMVKIGGHVFKGFLYDQGVDEGRGGDDHNHVTTTSDSNNNNAILNISELHLGGAANSAVAGRIGAPSSSGMLMGADVYGGGSGGLLGVGGTNYGNPIN